MKSRFVSCTACMVLLQLSNASWAVGAGAGGRDIIHVPMSWCSVNGSPAETSPNVNGDTNTDAVLWRRHERPTDNIMLPQADISLRSGINDAWGSFNFPVIADPDVSNVPAVTESDTRGEDVNVNGAEFTAIINACDAAYNAIGKAGIGITAVNLGLYHDVLPQYVGVIGWGGCAEVAGDCAVPNNGRIAVIDNHYLFPSVPNRTFPGVNATTGFAYTLTDPVDGLVGHEVGHALSLDHRNSVTALMNPGIADNNADGQADNIALNAAEITKLRANALNVPGVEIDPPGVFNPGAFVAQIIPNDVRRPLGDKAGHLGLASVRATLNKATGAASLEQQLLGLLPPEFGLVRYCFLADGDGAGRGAQAKDLQAIDVPTGFAGAELVACVSVFPGQALRYQAWRWNGEGLVEVPTLLLPAIHTMAMYPHFAATNAKVLRPKDGRFPLFDIIHVGFNARNFGLPVLGKPFRVQAMIIADGKLVDILEHENKGAPFVLEDARFPHCFPAGVGAVGATVDIRLEGLPPSAPIHGLLGPMEVFHGTTDANGGGVIAFPIPETTTPGNHLVTVGRDGTALTADCTVKVVDPKACDGDLDKDGDVDGSDVRRLSKDFGRRDCAVRR